MFRLSDITTFEQDIKKSRFLAIAGPVFDPDSAKAFLAEHSDLTATHNCWAWRIGQAYRFSDDGEPSGTGGKPILQAIDGHDLDCAIVLVVRWFGGILLGAGGLIRAYGGTAALCLKGAPKTEFVAEVEASLQCGFSDLALLKARLAARSGLRITSEQFNAEGAVLTLMLPEADADATRRLVTDLTSGRSALRWS